MGELGITPGHASTTDLVKLALSDTANYVKLGYGRKSVPITVFSEDEFLRSPNLSERENIRADLKAAVIATELIIGGFGVNNSPVLFYTHCINVKEQTSPGFFCGGSGSIAALNWLNFRGQNCFMGSQRSLDHLREAQHFATLSRSVGSTAATLLLRPGTPAKAVTTGEDSFLMEWAQEFFIKGTLPLDAQDRRDKFTSSLGIALRPFEAKKSFI
jgi:hypothetical protein